MFFLVYLLFESAATSLDDLCFENNAYRKTSVASDRITKADLLNRNYCYTNGKEYFTDRTNFKKDLINSYFAENPDNPYKRQFQILLLHTEKLLYFYMDVIGNHNAGDEVKNKVEDLGSCEILGTLLLPNCEEKEFDKSNCVARPDLLAFVRLDTPPPCFSNVNNDSIKSSNYCGVTNYNKKISNYIWLTVMSVDRDDDNEMLRKKVDYFKATLSSYISMQQVFNRLIIEFDPDSSSCSDFPLLQKKHICPLCYDVTGQFKLAPKCQYFQEEPPLSESLFCGGEIGNCKYATKENLISDYNYCVDHEQRNEFTLLQKKQWLTAYFENNPNARNKSSYAKYNGSWDMDLHERYEGYIKSFTNSINNSCLELSSKRPGACNIAENQPTILEAVTYDAYIPQDNSMFEDIDEDKLYELFKCKDSTADINLINKYNILLLEAFGYKDLQYVLVRPNTTAEEVYFLTNEWLYIATNKRSCLFKDICVNPDLTITTLNQKPSHAYELFQFNYCFNYYDGDTVYLYDFKLMLLQNFFTHNADHVYKPEFNRLFDGRTWNVNIRHINWLFNTIANYKIGDRILRRPFSLGEVYCENDDASALKKCSQPQCITPAWCSFVEEYKKNKNLCFIDIDGDVVRDNNYRIDENINIEHQFQFKYKLLQSYAKSVDRSQTLEFYFVEINRLNTDLEKLNRTNETFLALHFDLLKTPLGSISCKEDKKVVRRWGAWIPPQNDLILAPTYCSFLIETEAVKYKRMRMKDINYSTKEDNLVIQYQYKQELFLALLSGYPGFKLLSYIELARIHQRVASYQQKLYWLYNAINTLLTKSNISEDYFDNHLYEFDSDSENELEFGKDIQKKKQISTIKFNKEPKPPSCLDYRNLARRYILPALIKLRNLYTVIIIILSIIIVLYVPTIIMQFRF